MKIKNKSLAVKILTCVFLLFSCFYMYDFYKCLSGFIANGFREPLVMLPMILSFFLPVFCFLFFFYDFFIGKIKTAVKVGYSVFVILYGATALALIFSKISLYVANNSFGSYDALPSIIVHFPYDMIIILSAIIIWQVFNLIQCAKPEMKSAKFIEGLKERGTVHAGKTEYIILSVFAVVIFVFAGASVYAIFSAFSNALYDLRYLYLILWVLLIPLGNLLVILLKPERMDIKKSKKLAVLSGMIGANLIFALLFAIFELTSPDFMVHIGKPIFLITFSISLPIEVAIIFGIMAIATIVLAVRLAFFIKHSALHKR